MLSSKRKRYLSGSDWVINTLDYMMKASTCAGNMSQIVLMLDGRVTENEVRTRMQHFMKKFPVLGGSVARDFKLTPYWKIPAGFDRELNLQAEHVKDFNGPDPLLPLLEKTANAPFRDDRDHLAFHLFSDSRRSALAMAFDHRMFDARGAESFLNLFTHSLNNGGPPSELTFTSSMALTEWKKKFLAGRTVNRRIIALSKSTPQSFPIPGGKGGRFRYRLLSFTEQESAKIYENAYTEAGYLLESPYLLSVITQAMHELLKRKEGAGTSYLIPVTMDLRPGTDPVQETFFNHVSYLFYQIPVSAGDNRKELIRLFKQQMYDQVKGGFPKDLAEASLLTRIAPLPLLGKLLHIPLKGKMATFVFSHLGKSAYQSSDLLGAGIERIFHMPRVPVPPGLGFFSSFYNGRLSLVISYLDGLMSDLDLETLESRILAGFGVRQP